MPACRSEASVERMRSRVLKNVKATVAVIVGVDQPLFVNDREADLDAAGHIAGRGGRDEVADLFDARGCVWKRNSLIDQTVDSNASVVEGADKRVLQIRGCGAGKVGGQILSAGPSTSVAEIVDIVREWSC